ncbi:PPE family protein [Saccharothrix sp. AJ9571]|nr:PPE family protein [Saccharothrix sp. AJ9571]
MSPSHARHPGDVARDQSAHEGQSARERRRAKKRRVKRKREREREQNLRDADVFAPINWRVYEHYQLWKMIKSAEPGAVGSVAHHWGVLARELSLATSDIQATMQELMFAWQGPSAQRAAASVSTLTQWASTASDQAHGVGLGLDNYNSAISEAQRKIPEPVHYYAERWFKDGRGVSPLDGPDGLYFMNNLLDDHLPKKQQAADAKNDAVRVMTEYEDASRDTHRSLPQPFAATPAITTDPAPTPPAPPPEPRPDDAAPNVPPRRNDADDAAGENLDFGSTHAAATTTAPGGTPGPTGLIGADGLARPGSGPNWAPGANPVLGAGPGALAGQPGGPAALTGSGNISAAASPRGGSAAGGAGFYPPLGGQNANQDQDTEHRVRWVDGLDLMDDIAPAYPSVLGE